MTEVTAGRLPAEERVVLRDGSTVHIRPIGPGDGEALAAAFEKLSAEARYRRFLAPVKHLDGTMLKYLTDVDHVCHEALVAVEPDNGELVGVGLGHGGGRHATRSVPQRRQKRAARWLRARQVPLAQGVVASGGAGSL